MWKILKNWFGAIVTNYGIDLGNFNQISTLPRNINIKSTAISVQDSGWNLQHANLTFLKHA